MRRTSRASGSSVRSRSTLSLAERAHSDLVTTTEGETAPEEDAVGYAAEGEPLDVERVRQAAAPEVNDVASNKRWGASRRVLLVVAAVAAVWCSPTPAARGARRRRRSVGEAEPGDSKKAPGAPRRARRAASRSRSKRAISGEARTAYDNALRLLEQERYEHGVAQLLAVTEQAPDLTTPHVDLGIAYARIGDLERAAASLTSGFRSSIPSIRSRTTSSV